LGRNQIATGGPFGQAGQQEADKRLLDTIDSVAARFGAGKLQVEMPRETRD
jgi:hypothetical protein